MTEAQVQSGATAHQAMQPSRPERQLYDSCAQDFYGANQRLSLEKNHGQPFQKACSKSCGSSSAQGGHRIRLRPQWPGVVQRRPRTQKYPIQIIKLFFISQIINFIPFQQHFQRTLPDNLCCPEPSPALCLVPRASASCVCLIPLLFASASFKNFFGGPTTLSGSALQEILSPLGRDKTSRSPSMIWTSDKSIIWTSGRRSNTE